jgi:probable rRNA maturation factor
MKTEPPPIAVHNRQRKARLNLPEMQEFAMRALTRVWRVRRASSRLTSLPCIDIVFISDRPMAQLHRQFMKADGPTDVITFQHGEIVISLETAMRQAHAFHTSRQYELRLYLIHGLLHLAGWDDRVPTDARSMARLQEKILTRLSA